MSVTVGVENRTRLLDTIDLTGEETIIETKAIQEDIPVVALDLDGSIVDGANEKVKATKRKILECEVCLEEQSKYTCPACKLKACCLACVQKHKRLTGCTGSRDLTKFVPKTEMNNFHLLSDYRFLEEANRLADNAKCDYKSKPAKMMKKDQILMKGAKKSGVKLFRMTKGMKRWKENKSRFEIKEDSLFWTIKFVFSDVNEEVITRHAETDTMRTCLQKYIQKEDATSENKIRFSKYINRKDDQEVSIFLKQELEPADLNLRYLRVDINKTIKDALVGQSILEYPIFYIVLPQTAQSLKHEKFVEDTFVLKNSSSDSSDLCSESAPFCKEERD